MRMPSAISNTRTYHHSVHCNSTVYLTYKKIKFHMVSLDLEPPRGNRFEEISIRTQTCNHFSCFPEMKISFKAIPLQK
jgi:hypothetical protein